MDTSAETVTSPEPEKVVDHAWLFDVDGVITNPEEKKVTESELFDEIIKRLQKGEPVALVTGRALDWLEDKVVTPLEAHIKDRDILENFYVSGEFGGAYITYRNGQKELFANAEIAVPKQVVKKARQITEKEFADSMFWDEDKKTMVSIEMHDGFQVSKFWERQKELVPKLNELLKDNSIDGQFEVHADRIATNIRDKRLNKHFAAKQVIEWLQDKQIRPKNFVVFGDNRSDQEMANEIYSNGMNVEFVFVGEKEQLEGIDLPFPVTFTQAQCEKGTLEYLK